MLHARKDYDCIQDPSGKIGEDEPVFLLRATDMFAPAVLREWARLVGRIDRPLAEHVRKHAKRMEEWQDNNKHKHPDTPREVRV